MAHQINITLTDEEYKALAAKVGEDERLLEKRLHDLLAQDLRTSPPLGRSLPIFVSADTDLLSIAQVEGFDVENPNDH
jgi:hypothetical protein